LADAFKRAGIVERTARGVDTIFHEVLRTGRRSPTYARDTETGVALTLHGGPADLAYVRLQIEEGRAGRPLGLAELLVLDRVRAAGRVLTEEVPALIQADEGEAAAVLGRLASAQLLVRVGAGIEPAPALGRPGSLARAGRPERSAIEARVLDAVEKTGSITRGEVEQLCGLGPDQAKRVLRRLVNAGKLVGHGTTKGTMYTKTPE
jgi:ATP-dependent DNA helicase RecG